MEDAGLLLLVFGSGAAVTLLVVWVFLRLRKRDLREKTDNILSLARKEAEIQARDLRTRAEQEISLSRSHFQDEQLTASAQRQTAETELVETRARLETRADELARRESFFNSRHAEIEALRDQLERQSQLYRERLRAAATLNEEQLRSALREEVRTESAA